MKRLILSRAAAMLLSVVLVLTTFTALVVAEKGGETEAKSAYLPAITTGQPSAATLSSTATSGSTDFCRMRLGEDERGLYDAIDTTVTGFEGSAGFAFDDFSEDTVLTATASGELTMAAVQLVVAAYFSDHPQYFWVSNVFAYSTSASGTTLTLYVEPDYYSATVRIETAAAIRATEARWAGILESCSSDYEKVRVLHDLICRETDYAYAADGVTPETSKWAHSIVGVMTGMGAVCNGYAKTFQYMLNRCGIDAVTISGEGFDVSGGVRRSLGAHAWNAVKIDGEYYLVDVTWDDIGTIDGFDKTRFGYSVYDYFCTQSSVFSESHVPYTLESGGFVALEDGVFSDDTSHEYYRVCGGYLDGFDSEGASLDEFTQNAISMRADSLIYIVSKDINAFGSILPLTGSEEYTVLGSQVYGYVMIVFRERRHVAAPESPTFAKAAPDRVVLRALSGREYSADGVNWQASGEFADVTPGQQLTLYCRVARTTDTYASEPSEPLCITVPAVELTPLGVASAAPELVSDINLNLFVRSGDASPYDSVRLTVEMCGGTCELDNAAVTTVSGEPYIKFRYTGIAAKQMTDTLTVRVIGTLDGADYPGETLEYSVRDYCMYQLHNSDDDELRTLCADLLCYGTAAQKFFGYRTDDLADAQMTTEQRTFATSTMPNLTSKLSLDDVPATAEVKFVSAMLSLDGDVSVVCMFDSEAEDGRISFEVWLDADGDGARGEGEVQVVPVDYEKYTLGGRVYRKVNIGAIPARLMRSDIYVTAYVDGKTASARLHYSVETYAAAMVGGGNEPLAGLCAAMMRYSDSACRYAGK